MTADGDRLGDYLRWPTPTEELYRWWKNALLEGRGKEIVIVNEEPECGWFKTRLVKNGPYVPARIWMYQPTDAETGELVADEIMQAEINGAFANPISAWERLCAHPITEQEWQYMTATVTWAKDHAPDHPLSDPSKPIDNLKTILHF